MLFAAAIVLDPMTASNIDNDLGEHWEGWDVRYADGRRWWMIPFPEHH